MKAKNTTEEVVQTRESLLAEELCHWISGNLTTRFIKKVAKHLDIPIGFSKKNRNNFNVLFQEMLILNMWLVVHVCEEQFDNRQKCEECLDILHSMVYGRYTKGTKREFTSWKKSLRLNYMEYSGAMGIMTRLSAPPELIANVFSKHLFGSPSSSPELHKNIMNYINKSIQYLDKVVQHHMEKQCD